MKLGICLTGGGAKGAFQAGILKRMFEEEVTPRILTGTSIGAVNAYFVMRGRMEELFYLWNNVDKIRFEGKYDKAVDNSALIKELIGLEGDNPIIENVYVNYVHVENQRLSERVVDIRRLEKDRALEAVKYSSLLPFRGNENTNSQDSILKFDSQRVFEAFREDVKAGVYDGWNLDGGILNNTLLSPFIDNRVDKILIIALKNGFKAPEYIYDYYDAEDIIVLEPDIEILPGDTLRFELNYCRDMFGRGYEAAAGISQKITNQK